MKRLVVVASVLFLPSAASAADWTYVTTDSTGSRYFADYSSLKPYSEYVSLWREVDNSGDRTVKYRSSKSLWIYDCKSRRSALKQYVAYNADGTIYGSEDVPDYRLNFEGTVPETIGESFMQLACGAE